jgi:hypothetical protein
VQDGSTTQDVTGVERNRRGHIGRRVALSVIALIVAAGATGWLGVHAQTTSASAKGYHLSVTYPRVARAGLDVPWELRLTSPDGFDSDITIAISADYYDIFEFQGMHPEPSDETSDGKFVYLTFSAPKTGNVFTTALDTYVQPGSQIGRHATTSAEIDGHVVASVSYTTTVMP